MSTALGTTRESTPGQPLQRPSVHVTRGKNLVDQCGKLPFRSDATCRLEAASTGQPAIGGESRSRSEMPVAAVGIRRCGRRTREPDGGPYWADAPGLVGLSRIAPTLPLAVSGRVARVSMSTRASTIAGDHMRPDEIRLGWIWQTSQPGEPTTIRWRNQSGRSSPSDRTRRQPLPAGLRQRSVGRLPTSGRRHGESGQVRRAFAGSGRERRIGCDKTAPSCQ